MQKNGLIELYWLYGKSQYVGIIIPNPIIQSSHRHKTTPFFGHLIITAPPNQIPDLPRRVTHFAGGLGFHFCGGGGHVKVRPIGAAAFAALIRPAGEVRWGRAFRGLAPPG
jgi:hypothetical protein